MTARAGITLLRPAERAAHYRKQAASLRDMADNERDASFRADLIELSERYESLAHSIELDYAADT